MQLNKKIGLYQEQTCGIRKMVKVVKKIVSISMISCMKTKNSTNEFSDKSTMIRISHSLSMILLSTADYLPTALKYCSQLLKHMRIDDKRNYSKLNIFI